MKEFWIADTHAGHRNIIKYCNRPFSNVREMDDLMVKNWNSVVGPDDLVWHLGDVAFCCTLDYALNFMKRLNGRKHLILGNHDDLALEMNNVRPGTWQLIDKMFEIKTNDQLIVMCHYPMNVWHHAYKGSWQLYGHVHGTNQNHGKSIDVGVDCWNFTPVSFDQLETAMARKKVSEVIHNKWDKTQNEITTI